MKEIARILKGRYCAVNANEEEQQCHLSFGNNSENSCTGNQKQMTMHRAVPADKNRRKSLNANRSMHPARVISSFFNDRQSNGRARAPKCAFLLLAIGVLAITTAVLVKIFQPYDLIFKWKLVMEKEGEIFELWEKPPVDLYIKIYLFNITNAEAFLKGKEKLNVQQVGPYVYKEIMTHENITFNANNTMSTIPSHPLVWQEHLSEGNKEDDEVIMVDIALLSAVHTANKNYITRLGIRFLGSEPIKRMTARQFMFGFPSHLTSLGNTLFGSKIPFDAVGLIDRMYDFRGDYETFHTGVPNPAISGLYATYRGEPNLPNWPNGEHCSNIELASDGTKFKSFIQPNETLKFFRKSMCRPINLYRTGEIEKHGSLTGYKYVFEENALDNGAINEKNKCFCREGRCQPQGLLDVSDCYYTFPISLSYPHFMDGEPGLQNNVTGLTPNKDLHSSTFVIQPESGLPLSIGVRMQINMHFNDMPRNHESRYFKDLTVPMLWFDIMMPKLTDELDTRFNLYINYLPYLDILGFWGGLFLGIALVAYAVSRATISMSTYVETRNYSKSNLFNCGNNVYQPCEMKLLNTNEKPDSLIIARSIPNISSDTNDTCDILYTEISMKNRPMSAFALEMEPVLSDDSSDEGHDSDTATLSPHSTASSNMDINSDESDSIGRSKNNNCSNFAQGISQSSSDSCLISSTSQSLVNENEVNPNGSTVELSPHTSDCTTGLNKRKDERLPV